MKREGIMTAGKKNKMKFIPAFGIDDSDFDGHAYMAVGGTCVFRHFSEMRAERAVALGYWLLGTFADKTGIKWS